MHRSSSEGHPTSHRHCRRSAFRFWFHDVHSSLVPASQLYVFSAGVVSSPGSCPRYRDRSWSRRWPALANEPPARQWRRRRIAAPRCVCWHLSWSSSAHNILPTDSFSLGTAPGGCRPSLWGGAAEWHRLGAVAGAAAAVAVCRLDRQTKWRSHYRQQSGPVRAVEWTDPAGAEWARESGN